MTDAPPSFSEWLNSTGRALGFPTSAALARALGIQQSTVSRWKTKNSQPGVEHLAKISDLFGVELKSLLVLAGYLEASPGIATAPAVHISFEESMINGLSLSERFKDVARGFWAERVAEERSRLASFLLGLEEAVVSANVPDLDEPDRTWAAQISDTRVARQVGSALLALEDALKEAREAGEAMLTAPQDASGRYVFPTVASVEIWEAGELRFIAKDARGDTVVQSRAFHDPGEALLARDEFVRMHTNLGSDDDPEA